MNMRYVYIAAMVAISFLTGVCLTAEKGYGYDGGVVYYYPAPRVAYYSSYTPVYYSRPVYNAQPTYYSYYSPCVCYTPPDSCQESYSDQRSDARGYSQEQPTPAQPTTSATVGAYDNRFSPQSINVQPGTTVRWVNYGQHSHTITSNDNRWDSGDIKPGATYSATFKHPGTYYYYCRHHTQDKMRGVIVVASAAVNGSSGNQSPSY
jgi:plastocyanin